MMLLHRINAIQNLETHQVFFNKLGHAYGAIMYYSYLYYYLFYKKMVKNSEYFEKGLDYNKLLHQFNQTKFLPILCHIIFIIIVFMIGFSRIYLGVHSIN